MVQSFFEILGQANQAAKINNHEIHQIHEKYKIFKKQIKTRRFIEMNNADYNVERRKLAEGVILYKDECFAIQGAVYEVYRTMGCGYLEAVYQECLEKELNLRKIPFYSQQPIFLNYKGERLLQTYKPDLVCYGKIIVEIKAVKDVADEHAAQVFNYLKGSGMRLGLLVNFGHYPKATIKRIVL